MYLRNALSEAKRELRRAARGGNRLAGNVLSGIEWLENSKDVTVTVSAGDVQEVGFGETSPDGHNVTIDYAKGRRAPVGSFYPTFTLTHELGHSYSLIGPDGFLRSKSALNAVQWGNAVRGILGGCLQGMNHAPARAWPGADGSC